MNLTPDTTWQHEPGVPDPLERLTWARLKWKIGQHSATRVRDSVAERNDIFVPLFPIARWIVAHWWSLLYEVAPTSPAPMLGDAPAAFRPWLERHCLRLADSSLLLPDLTLCSAGRDMTLRLRRDGSSPLPPADRPAQLRYLDDAEIRAGRDDVALALGALVDAALNQARSLADDRVTALAADWDATRAATGTTGEFCRAAGRLGLDPLSSQDWPNDVLAWVEGAPAGTLDSAFAVDLLESTDDVADKPRLDRALRKMSLDHRLKAGPSRDAPPAAPDRPWQVGYGLAEEVRSGCRVAASDRFSADLADVTDRLCGAALRQESNLDFPDGQVLALAGWQDGQRPWLALRRGRREDSARFTMLRALYFGMWAAVGGPRLVTDAQTWDQQVSRAFAAEVLAPRAGVVERFEPLRKRCGVDEALADVADHYGVSRLLVEHQLANVRQRG